ncbi:MAG: WbqC family protein [Candidatus Marinimicrobia bacterium]|nr:WbqC family protein [Candidatus Neomarinimicrobiota bacterium]
MASADIFLLLDTVQYTKLEYDNRCKIKTPDGVQWLTVPVGTPKSHTLTKDVRISGDSDWKRTHRRTLINNYSKSVYFKDYDSELLDIYEIDWKFLVELNVKFIHTIKKWLGIKTTVMLASDLAERTLKSTELNISYCKELNADIYLSGIGGKDYLKPELFEENGIRLEFQNYTPVKYPQRFGEFIPDLSVIDLIFNRGDESLSLIMDGN